MWNSSEFPLRSRARLCDSARARPGAYIFSYMDAGTIEDHALSRRLASAGIGSGLHWQTGHEERLAESLTA
jgi:hypothetical protein